jgi:hypothetical protein
MACRKRFYVTVHIVGVQDRELFRFRRSIPQKNQSYSKKVLILRAQFRRQFFVYEFIYVHFADFLKAVPAVRCIFCFLKKKAKGCRFHQG